MKGKGRCHLFCWKTCRREFVSERKGLLSPVLLENLQERVCFSVNRKGRVMCLVRESAGESLFSNDGKGLCHIASVLQPNS